MLWILLEKLDLCKRRLVTSNILVTSGTTQKRGNVTSQVFLSSLGELCQVLAPIQVCAGQVVHFLEQHMLHEGGEDVERTRDLPAREQGINEEKLQWRACPDVPRCFLPAP